MTSKSRGIESKSISNSRSLENELLRLVCELEKNLTVDKKTRQTKGTPEKISQLKGELSALIQQAITNNSKSRLAIYFIESVAQQYLSHNISLLCEILDQFNTHGFFDPARDEALEAQLLSITLLHKLSLLTAKTKEEWNQNREERGKLLASINFANNTLDAADTGTTTKPTIVILPPNTNSSQDTTNTEEKSPGEEAAKQPANKNHIKPLIIDHCLETLAEQSKNKDEKSIIQPAQAYSSLLNDVYTAFEFDIKDSRLIFSRLQNSTVLPASIYLIELMQYLGLFAKDKTNERKELVRIFLYSNTHSLTDKTWINAMFKRLFDLHRDLKTFGENELCEVISSILDGNQVEGISNSSECIPPGSSLYALDQIWQYHFNNYTESQKNIPLQSVAAHLIREQIDKPFQAVTADSETFFGRVFKYWYTATNATLPHHSAYLLENHDDEPYLQIQPEQKSDAASNKPEDILTQYFIYIELYPLLQDELAFIDKVTKLFPHDISRDEVRELWKQLATSVQKQFSASVPSNTPPMIVNSALTHAILHKLNRMRNAEEIASVTSAEFLTRFFNKQDCVVFVEKYDADKKHTLLVEEKGEAQEREGVNKNDLKDKIALLHEKQSDGETIQHLLVPAKLLIPSNNANDINTLKKRLFFGKLLQIIVNSTTFVNIPTARYFKEVPNLLFNDNLSDAIFYQLFKHKNLPRANNPEEKASDDVEKANALFRALGDKSYYPSPTFVYSNGTRIPVSLYEKTKTNFPYEQFNQFAMLPYFQLFKAGIAPEFYERFNNRETAQHFILTYIANRDFLELYQYDTQNIHTLNLIHLIVIPDLKSLIDETVLKHLNTLQKSIEDSKQHDSRQTIFVMLRSLFIQFDFKNADHADMLTHLTKVVRIFKRFNNSETKVINQLSEIILSKIDIANKLDTLIKALKQTHPVLEDIDEAADTIFTENNPSALLQFIIKLNERRLLEQLTNDSKGKKLIEDILKQEENSHTPQILAYMQGINFNDTTTTTNLTWLEFAWSNRLWSAALALLNIGVKANRQYAHGNQSFIDDFIVTIYNNPGLLVQKPIYRILLWLFKNEQTNIQVALQKHMDPYRVINNGGYEEKSSSSITLEYKGKIYANDRFTAIAKFIKNEDAEAIALILISIKRFDLLKMLNDIYVKSNTKDLWDGMKGTTYYQTDPNKFDTAFIKALDIDVKYLRYYNNNYFNTYMSEPGFFTDYHMVFNCHEAWYRTNDYHGPLPSWKNIDPIKIALQTVNNKPCDVDLIKRYRDALVLLDNKHSKEWQANDNTKMLVYLIRTAIEKNAASFTLDEITLLLTSLASLKIKDLYPIENKLTTIFSQPPNRWCELVAALHDDIHNFEIRGMDSSKVKAQFYKTNHSFDKLLNRSDKKPIEYFFKIFANVTDAMRGYSYDETVKGGGATKQTLDALKGMYNNINNMPGLYNETADTNFFTSLSMISKYTLGIHPYHAQFVTLMGTMYAIPKIKKLLVDVASGQGKTLIIAHAVACVVKMFPEKKFIPVTTLTKHLARDNATDNKPFYDALDITSGYDVYKNTRVRYTTSRELLFKIISDEIKAKLEEQPGSPIQKIISTVINKFNGTEEKIDPNDPYYTWAIFLDETDVDLGDRRGKYILALGLALPEFNHLLKVIWSEVSDNKAFELFKTNVINSDVYKNLPADSQQHFNDLAYQFYYTAINSKKIVNERTDKGTITTFENETGIVSSDLHGNFGEPQFIQLNKYGQDYNISTYQIVHHIISYQDAFKRFGLQIGFSGTLGSELERDAYKLDGFETVDTARFNAQRLVILPPKLCKNYISWADELINITKLYTEQVGLPVLIFVKKPQDVGELKKYFDERLTEKKINILVGEESHEKYKEIVTNATKARNITIASIIGGRGVDYILNDIKIDDAGGLVEITATLPETENVELQLQIRTARRDNNGISISVYNEEEVREIFATAKVYCEDLNIHNLSTKIAAMRSYFLQKKFEPEEMSTGVKLGKELVNNFYRDPKLTNYRGFAFVLSLATSASTAAEVKIAKERYRKEINPKF